MLTRINCPSCGNSFDLQQAWDDEDARRFVELLINLPHPLTRPFFSYLKLFKPKKQALRWSRVLSISRELEPMIKSLSVTRNGIKHAVPLALWESGLNEMLNKSTLTLPLANHGYLLEMLANQANKFAAIQEAELEEQRRNGLHRPRSAVQVNSGLQSVNTVINKETFKKSTPPANWKGALTKPKTEE